MKRFLSTLMIALSMLVGASLQAQAQSGQDGMMMPPRLIGSLEIDGFTKAPLQIAKSVRLEAKPSRVFAYVSDSSNWPEWFDFIASVSLEAGGQAAGKAGTVRRFHLADGGFIKERIVAYEEPSLFAYSVDAENPFGIGQHLGVFQFQSGAKGETVLTWHQFFSHPEPEPVHQGVGGSMDGVLSRLIDRFGGSPRGSLAGVQQVVITAERTVRAPVERVWSLTAEGFGDVHQWSSIVTHATLERPADNGWVGAQRSCTVPGTPGFKETMLTFDEDARTFRYQVLEGLPPFIARGTNTWTLESVGAGRTVVRMRAEFAVVPGTPPPAVGMMRTQFFQLLEMTADELAHFVDTGKPHPRSVVAAAR